MMQLSKNKKYQYSFFLLIVIYSLFNGGNSNLLIQINFLLISFFFIFCLKDKNYNLHFKYFVNENKRSINFYILFLFYLLFQILPLPIDLIRFFSPEKYNYLITLNPEFSFTSISLAPSNSFFQLINFCSLLIVVFILKMIFYRDEHKNRFHLFLSFIGFVSAFIGTFLYLSGYTDFLTFKSYNKGSVSTGFFISRTVFSIFLLFCLVSSLEYLKNSKNYEKNFITSVYVRLFIVFIAIGLITTFSRIGNFLLLNTMLFYLINEIFFKKKKKYIFKNIIMVIILFDIFILGVYFGSSRIVDRFLFLENDFSEILNPDINLLRFQIIKFAFYQINNYLFFGYGPGSFEILFNLKFPNLLNSYANHAHSGLTQFIGEFGLVGFGLFLLSIKNLFFKSTNYNLINCLLLFYLFIILIFDFSLHIPLIQFLFVCFFILNQKFIKLIYGS
jgi:hypothetical protein